MGLIAEFKEFVSRGNVLDLAVGVVIGASFGKIVTAFVDKVIMPPIGLLIGGVDFSKWVVTLKEATLDAAGKEVPAVVLGLGEFVNAIIQFVIIALAIFMGTPAGVGPLQPGDAFDASLDDAIVLRGSILPPTP
jgi:large conductance mechanosensitive channel